MEKLKIDIVTSEQCTGCEACYNGCPKDAISMLPDEEGFLSPVIDPVKCINCGICAQICPALNYKLTNDPEPECFAVWANDDIRMKSSSGGMFSLIADYVLENGGSVCGAAFTEDYRDVKHIVISNKNELYRLRGSKYVQSDIGLVYREILDILKQDRYVLFSGCPCQVAGLYSFLRRDYPKLITCDLVCHGANSPMAYHAFLNEREKESNSKVISVNFRDKQIFGWDPGTVIYFKNGKSYKKKIGQCTWLRGFLRGIINRQCCSVCKYATPQRVGDFTLADFWQIEKENSELNDGKGTSCVLLNTSKGKAIFYILKSKFKKYEKISFEFAKTHNGQLIHPQNAFDERNRFFDLLSKKGFDTAIVMTFNRKFDIGVVGWWYGENYGSTLTYYALHTILNKMGYSVLMIDFPKKIPDQNHKNSFSRKFARKFYRCSKHYLYRDLVELNKYCETFLLGSDQLFNYYCIAGEEPFYLLDFAGDSKKKLAYATSFGHQASFFPEDNLQLTTFRLKRFDAISVREKDGVNICKKFGVDAIHVLDPVFLCDLEDYKKLAENSKLKENENFALAYILDPSLEIKNFILNISKKLSLNLRVILDAQYNLEENKRKIDLIENIVNISEEEEWIYYFSKCDFVVTDSFHGLCLSIIFKKQFIVLSNKKRGISRIKSLLEDLNLEDRLVNTPLEITNINYQNELIDYSEVDNLMNSLKLKSYKWLETELKTNNKNIEVVKNNTDKINEFRSKYTIKHLLYKLFKFID